MTSLLTRAEHVWQKRGTPEAKQLIRYTLVSVISTAVSLVVLALVFGVFHLWAEVGSTVFANVVASVPSYFLTRNWVWGKSGRSHLVKEIIPFWVMSGLGIAFSIIGAATAKAVGRHYGFSHLEQTLLVEAANITSFAVFWVAKYLVFNRIFKVHPLEELDELVEAA
ncbi:MAG: GtrA family protein [Acidimicrobiales bacterium]|jgi:putative flippase GtrA